nr:hypothetical protein [Tanacetum cinerariifolium]
SLRQILHPYILETIIQNSSNIVEHSITEFVQFINPHQLVLLVFILIDESSWIRVSSVSFLALQIGTMFVIAPFNNLKFGDNDDSTFKVDISRKLPVDCKSIELLTFMPAMRDSPESIFVKADRFLTPHCTRHQVFNPLDVPIICCLSLRYKSYVLVTKDSLRQILHPYILETIIQNSSNIVERSITEFVQFINPHQLVLLVFILIDESSWIRPSSNKPLQAPHDPLRL